MNESTRNDCDNMVGSKAACALFFQNTGNDFSEALDTTLTQLFCFDWKARTTPPRDTRHAPAVPKRSQCANGYLTASNPRTHFGVWVDAIEGESRHNFYVTLVVTFQRHAGCIKSGDYVQKYDELSLWEQREEPPGKWPQLRHGLKVCFFVVVVLGWLKRDWVGNNDFVGF